MSSSTFGGVGCDLGEPYGVRDRSELRDLDRDCERNRSLSLELSSHERDRERKRDLDLDLDSDSESDRVRDRDRLTESRDCFLRRGDALLEE